MRTTDGRPLSPAGLVAAGRVAGAPTTPATRALSRGQSLVYLGTALTTAEAWTAAKALQARADVVWAEPDLPVYASDASPVTPNDPRFAEQWDAWDQSPASGGYSTRVPATLALMEPKLVGRRYDAAKSMPSVLTVPTFWRRKS